MGDAWARRIYGRCLNLKQFLWIGETTGSRPLIIQLPAALQKRRAFGESIRAAEEHYHQMTLIHGLLLALANHFRLAVRIQYQTLPRSRGRAGSGSPGPAGDRVSASFDDSAHRQHESIRRR